MKILFITSNRLGDAVLSTGLLGHLVTTAPDARFTIACGPLAESLFRAVPRVERVIALPKQPWSAHWLTLWQGCVGTLWDVVVDLRNSLVSRLLPTRHRAVVPRPLPGRHRVEQLARTLGLREIPPPRLWFGAHDLATAAQWIPDGGPVLALAPTANWAAKTWRSDRFAELARRLTAADGVLPGARVAVLAAASERPQAQPVLDALDPARRIDLIGRADPLQVAACLARCDLFIGNDSGLMHLAAAAGIPTLGLFGPGLPEFYAPWGPRSAVVTTPVSGHALMAAPGFNHRTTGTLMDSLTVDAVVSAAAALWTRIDGLSE
ncbi:MAG: glycosyltransferase family 9 protein [Azospirillum sp.]|nr:glycosyltransferase family 9 protein [Azospirillum sp.]